MHIVAFINIIGRHHLCVQNFSNIMLKEIEYLIYLSFHPFTVETFIENLGNNCIAFPGITMKLNFNLTFGLGIASIHCMSKLDSRCCNFFLPKEGWCFSEFPQLKHRTSLQFFAAERKFFISISTNIFLPLALDYTKNSCYAYI